MTNKNQGPRLKELSEELADFLIGSSLEEMYSHRTAQREIADKILTEGFKFTESFQKTTDQIVNDIVYLRYWDSLRKHYGGYIIVIGIAKSAFEKVMNRLKSKFEIQQALSEILNGMDNEDEDMDFLLPEQFIKGYIVRETGEIVENNNYNPNYLPEYLDQNIDLLNSM